MVDTAFYVNTGPKTLADIAAICNGTLKDPAQGGLEIKDIASMDKAAAGEICFFYDKKKKDEAASIKASAVVATEELAGFVPVGVAVVIAANPKLAYVNLLEAFYEWPKVERSVSTLARIGGTAIFGENCHIGDYAVLEDGVRLGNNCTIEPGAVIMRGCQIGDGCIIGTGAKISHCIMGKGCFVYRNACIGQDGFGFIMVEGRHKKIPQMGRVIIGDDVEIGANTCIDRGALGDTVIGDGCRIDNLAQIAHNDVLGKGCVIVSGVGIAGSSVLGDYVVLGGQVGVADHVKIGSGAQVAAQSGIMREVEPGAILMGSPAVPIKDFMRQVAFLQAAGRKK